MKTRLEITADILQIEIIADILRRLYAEDITVKEMEIVMEKAKN
jgi:type III secretory pathway component EscV